MNDKERKSRYQTVLNLRKQGASFQKIADELGLTSRARAHQLFHDALVGYPIQRTRRSRKVKVSSVKAIKI
jgi:transcriptional regulator